MRCKTCIAGHKTRYDLTQDSQVVSKRPNNASSQLCQVVTEVAAGAVGVTVDAVDVECPGGTCSAADAMTDAFAACGC